MRILSPEARAYRTEAGWLALKWRRETGWEIPSRRSKVIMRVWFYWPDKRRRDQDNPLKQLQDSLTDVLWEDDRQVLPRVMDFAVDKHQPRVEIELEVMGEGDSGGRADKRDRNRDARAERRA
ncbi:crossover junction endodeoxyribonuclease RusA [Alicyclobacillus macrosporangiidus]|uniref:Crossover junction endodeoxyribonuclease RusA n=2 Tax=Alicyclobacillus macrosporangiidus TaxID=392015 RepID=A0A1I7ICV1_9BACL|nr:crossover junction endodeoxyribonuclease RusA [Alicyclobacillus macrosporangiidus]